MKRVVFVINDLRTGGAERVFAEDANRLVERGYSVTICLLYGSLKDDAFALELSPKVRSIELSAKGVFDLAALRRFRTLLREERPDACISTLNDANLFARFALLGVSGVRYLRREANELSMKPWWHRVLDLFFDWRTDGVIAVSDHIRRDIIRSNPWLMHAVMVLPNAVAVPEMTLQEKTGPPVILSVGSLTPKKDQATLLKACGLVRRKGIPFSLVVIGGGAERTNLEALAHAKRIADIVSFTGRLNHEEVGEWYKKASLFVLSSRTEGSPNVLLEAMAAGLPCVASDIPSMREVVDTGCAMLAPTGDILAFGAAIARLSQDSELRDRMGSHAREFVRQRFDPQRRLERLEAIIYGNH